MLREALVASVVLAAALAGCIDAPQTDLEPAATDADLPPAVAALGAVPAVENVTNVSDWWIISVDAAPDAPLASFRWTVPEGAVVPWAYNDLFEFDEDQDTVALEVAPIVGDPNASIDFLFAAFAEEDGKAVPVSTATMQTSALTTTGPLGGVSEHARRAMEPFFLHLGLSALKTGDEVGLVLAARSETPTTLALAFRVLEEDYSVENDLEPAETTEDFLDARGAQAPLALPVVATGSGYSVQAYVDVSVFAPPFGVWSYELRTGDIQVEGGVTPDARPVGGHRQQRIDAVYEPAGWGGGSATYFATSERVGTIDIAIDAHGTTADGSWTLAQTRRTWFANAILFGFPMASAMGDGEGAVTSTLRMDVAEVNDGIALLSVRQLALGATLEHLVGLPSIQISETWDGIAAPATAACPLAPAAHIAGDDLVILDACGHESTELGVLAALPAEARRALDAEWRA